jgi:His/Glu/Gln/Arg/opine family amino acid ABC transporter permease subunit
MQFDMSVIEQSWPLFVTASQTTALLFVLSLALATALGLVLALMRISGVAPLVWTSAAFVWVFRGIPALVVLFFTFYGLPALGLQLTALQSGVLGLGIDAAAYKAEIIRSGIISVDRGQMEAAQALAMSPAQYMRRVILPQAVRIMVPPYFSNAVSLLKATSLASVITVTEVTGIANRLIASTFRPIEILALVGLIYLAMSTVLILLQQLFERRLALKV